MQRKLIIWSHYHRHHGSDLLSAASFQFSLDKAERLLGVIELEPVSNANLYLVNNLGLALGLGIAANLLRSEQAITSLILQHRSGPIHHEWQTIANLFSQISGTTLQLEASLVSSPEAPATTGPVFLASGGKDTLYTLVNAQKNQKLTKGTPGIYLGAGSELNWRSEYSQVQELARHFGLRLHHVRLYQMLVSSKGALRFANRAVWRELVTMSLARQYGNHIFTGINNDAIAQLNITDPHYADFLSQLLPTVQAMEKILGAKIETAQGELEVYQQIRQHPLFSRSGSCLRPDCRQGNLCAKCRTFKVYEQVLSGNPLQDEDIAFIHSDHYLGDAALLSQYPM